MEIGWRYREPQWGGEHVRKGHREGKMSRKPGSQHPGGRLALPANSYIC